MRALVAEMNGQDWDVPALPPSGFRVNPVQEALNAEIKKHKDEGQPDPENYHGFAVLGVTGAVKQVAWHIREKWWGGADRRILLLPKDILSFLVNGARVELDRAREGQEYLKITTGDVLVAWILKVRDRIFASSSY